MSNWLIIKDNVIVDAVVSDSKAFVENNFDGEVIEDDECMGIGWTNITGYWKAPYPTDGLEYIWDEELKKWNLVFSPPEDSIIE
jgi:hypothetical protein